MKLISIVDADIKLEGDAEYLALTGFTKQEVVDAQMLTGITLAEACLVFMTLKTCCTVEEMMVFWRCILGQHRISHGSVHARFIGALSLLNDKLRRERSETKLTKALSTRCRRTKTSLNARPGRGVGRNTPWSL